MSVDCSVVDDVVGLDNSVFESLVLVLVGVSVEE